MGELLSEIFERQSMETICKTEGSLAGSLIKKGFKHSSKQTENNGGQGGLEVGEEK